MAENQNSNRKNENVRRANRIIQTRSFVLMILMGVVMFVLLFFQLFPDLVRAPSARLKMTAHLLGFYDKMVKKKGDQDQQSRRCDDDAPYPFALALSRLITHAHPPSQNCS